MNILSIYPSICTFSDSNI